jgi:16S rRNA (guanine966-N2)-methyltransferase
MQRKPSQQLSQQLRIIGGTWRGRKLSFPDLAEIRPTPNRVKETLFNWLAPVIQGAYCLDLFAGSGALGFEALSRGAEHVVMVDKSPTVIEHLRASCQLLKTTHVTLYQAEAPDRLILPDKAFDIIFLDPPFHHKLIKPSCEWLQAHHLINPHTLIYIETERAAKILPIPASWQIKKQGTTTETAYYLLCNLQLDKN